MPGIMWYFVIALVIILGVMFAVPSEGAQMHPSPIVLSPRV